METPQHSFFEPRRHGAPPLGTERGEDGLDTLRTAVSRSRKRFAVVNAVGWAAIVGLPTLTGIPVGATVAGELTVGMLLFAAQGCLLLATAVQFDRNHQGAYREWNGGDLALSPVGGDDRR
ncbi:hypothetical protein ACFVW8_08375 [Streptomyces sp. NPDC058221]|uniref:hypothetical protein n=1 Tax=Streptomyces sp. NPDC058221 TaxID=3346388 RepID=UPI0036E08291